MHTSVDDYLQVFDLSDFLPENLFIGIDIVR